MGDEFYLDPEAARRTAETQRSSGERLRTAHAHLTSVLDEHDGCWGTDDIGKNFSDGYVKNATQTRTDAGSVVEGLGYWSDGVESAIDGFSSLDGQNADDVDGEMAYQLEHPPPSP